MSRFKTILFSFALLLSGLIAGGQPTPLQPAPMPIHPATVTDYAGSVPQPHRDESVLKWMEPSLRIRNAGASGSGTICWYDKQKNLAWVISCAHLFKTGNERPVIEVFYKNGKKLSSPQSFNANVMAVKIGGYDDDISIMTFTPDWVPNYFPIAGADYNYKPDEKLYSCGCDGAQEVACYFIKVIGIRSGFLYTRENSPRPGRSGGGLMTEDGRFVGICVRTTNVDGTGEGLFVHLGKIHEFCKNNKLEFLLNINSPSDILKKIPIIDKTGPQQQHPDDYIPIP